MEILLFALGALAAALARVRLNTGAGAPHPSDPPPALTSMRAPARQSLTPSDREHLEYVWRATWEWFREDPEAALGILDQIVLAALEEQAPESENDRETAIAGFAVARMLAQEWALGRAEDALLETARLHYCAVFDALLPAAQPDAAEVGSSLTAPRR